MLFKILPKSNLNCFAPAYLYSTDAVVYTALFSLKVELMAPEDDVTRRMSVRLALLLKKLDAKDKKLDGKGKEKKSKILPRGDYLEFFRLVSVSFHGIEYYLHNVHQFILYQ